MKNKMISFALSLLVLASFPFISPAKSADKKAEELQSTEESGYAKTLPQFSLKDPIGKQHTRAELVQNGLVLVVTAPILSSERSQRGWSDDLENTKPNAQTHLVLVEDMSPSAFKGKALKEMKKDYKPGAKTLLLIDEQGELRKNLGVAEKKTVVLVYDAQGNLIYSEKGSPSVERARVIWEKLVH